MNSSPRQTEGFGRAVPVGANGRMNLPADVRRALGLEGAGKVFFEQDSEGVRIMTFAQRLERARGRLKPFVKTGERISDELIRERRAEDRSETSRRG